MNNLYIQYKAQGKEARKKQGRSKEGARKEQGRSKQATTIIIKNKITNKIL